MAVVMERPGPGQLLGHVYLWQYGIDGDDRMELLDAGQGRHQFHIPMPATSKRTDGAWAMFFDRHGNPMMLVPNTHYDTPYAPPDASNVPGRVERGRRSTSVAPATRTQRTPTAPPDRATRTPSFPPATEESADA